MNRLSYKHMYHLGERIHCFIEFSCRGEAMITSIIAIFANPPKLAIRKPAKFSYQ